MMNGTSFAYSGLPNYLEWYKCYDDPSAATWVDGMELYRDRGSWDQRSIDRWNFLYRPFRPAVGRPQKKKIRELRMAISTCKANIQTAQGYLATLADERLWQNRRATWTALGGSLACAGFWFYSQSAPAAAFSMLIPFALLSKVFTARRENRSRVGQLDENIRQNQEIIRRSEEGIGRLEDEIRQLVGKIPETFDAVTVASWLEDDLRQLELVCLGELLNESVTLESAHRHFRRSFGDPRVLGILIDSWGCLQPIAQRGPLGKESTGLGRALDQLGDRVSTWQIGPGGSPFFRLWYLQFVLPLAKNLNICSFFYDFVTRRSYGRRWEVLQYNHVATFSIREIDPETEAWAVGGVSPWSDPKSGSPKALTIATSSGVHFRCVLVDEDLADYFNEHLKCEEKIKELVEDLSREDSSPSPSANFDEFARWRAEEKAKIAAEIAGWMEKRRKIQLETAVKTRSMLGEIRQCVEDYVSRSERADEGFA